jgi:hypothetical protein
MAEKKYVLKLSGDEVCSICEALEIYLSDLQKEQHGVDHKELEVLFSRIEKMKLLAIGEPPEGY